MAAIVLGLATSHGAMLSIPPEAWTDRVAVDRAERHHYRGRRYDFDELAALRRDDGLAAQAGLEARRERRRASEAVGRLADVFAAEAPDVAILVGNDQMEVFTGDHVPAFAVFWGPYVEGIPRSPEFLAGLPPGIARAEADRTPEAYTRYPCLPELGRHLIERLVRAGFDPAQLTRLPTGAIGSNAAPHAYGFVYRRLMRDRVVPHVPVFVNTFYPPNQPTASRCYALGRALAAAAAGWDRPARIAAIASGGLSHFVIDEAFDREVLDALASGDEGAWARMPEGMFQSGTSEIKNWIVLAGMMREAGLGLRHADYVPCYRSEAGTGNAMGFACWR